jgi:DNA-binding transcriptional LysR family regulator
MWNEWHFGPPGAETIVRASGGFESNSADAIYHAALAGLGIARLPTYLVAADLRAGRLVHLLPDLVDDATSIVAVYVERRHLPQKIRAFIDHIAEVFSGTPPWDDSR